MSKFVAESAIRGAHEILARAQARFDEALAQHGEDKAVGFPETAFYLPMAYALLGAEVETLGEMGEVLNYTAGLLPPVPDQVAWLDNESMLWARVMRGMNSMAKTVILRAARVFTTSGLARGAI